MVLKTGSSWLARLVRWLLVGVAVAVIAGWAIPVLLLPRWVDFEKIQLQIAQEIQNNTGIRASIGKMSVRPTMFHGVEAIYDMSTFKDPDGRPLAEAGRIHVDVRYFPLFKREISISNVRFENVHVVVEPKSYWFKIHLPSAPRPMVYLNDSQIDLANYVIDLPDRDGQAYALKGGELVLSHLKSKKDLVLNGVGAFWLGDQVVGKYTTDAQIAQRFIEKNTYSAGDVKRVKATLSEVNLGLLPKDLRREYLAQSAGIIDRINLDVKGPGFLKEIVGQIRTKEPVTLSLRNRLYHFEPGKISFESWAKFDPKKNELVELTKINADSETALGIHPFSFKGDVDFEKQNINATVKTDRLNPDFIYRLVRGQAAQNQAIGGSITSRLTLSGKLKSPQIAGFAKFLDLNMHEGNTALFKNVNGEARFEEDNILIEKLSGELAKGRLKVEGRLNSAFKNSDLNLSLAHADLATLQKLVEHMAGQKLDMSVAGQADSKLHLSGPIKKLIYTGNIALKNTKLVYPARNLTLEAMNGTVAITPQAFTTKSLQGKLKKSPFIINGTYDKSGKSYNMHLISKNIQVRDLENALQDLAPNIQQQLADAGIQGGRADLDVIISSSIPGNIGGTIVVSDFSAQPVQLGVPIQLARLGYNFQTGKLDFAPSGVKLGPFVFKADGVATQKAYRIHLVSQKIPVESFRTNKAFFENLLHSKLPPIYNTAGSLQMEATIANNSQKAVLTFYDAGLSTPVLKYPIYQMNGKVNIALGKKFQANTDNLSLRYANSPTKVSFDIDTLQDMYIEAAGTLSPLAINEFPLFQNTTAIAYAAVPYEITLSGKLGKLWGDGAGNNLQMFFNVNAASLFSSPALEKPQEAGGHALDEANLSSVFHLKGDTLSIEETRFRAGNDSAIAVNGQIDNVFDAPTRHSTLSIKTMPELNLEDVSKALNQDLTNTLSGRIKADLKLDQTAQKLLGTGSLVLDKIKSDKLTLNELTGKVDFKGDKAELNVNRFYIPGVDVSFTATASDLFRYPWPLENFNLKGEEFVVTQYTDWLDKVVVGKVRQEFWEQFFPNTGRVGVLPFEITSGTLALKEGIVNNLIVEDFSSTIRLYPNTYFELDDAKAKSAGGSVTGHFAMNPRSNNFMTVHLDIDKMKANAVSRILLNVTNQIFGDLSGQIDYTTEGKDTPELLANTNGYADLRIENGRLPSVTRIENLLLAANTISGGLANLNLNSVFRLAAPFKTDYFATLTGTFKMVEGVIYTEDFLSKGKNLDLKARGAIHMAEGTGDMVLRGEMSREVEGVFGKIGTLSFGKFLGILPPLRMIVSRIPGLGFVPGFGGPKDEKGVAFEVTIDGPVIDPGSMKNFHWVQ